VARQEAPQDELEALENGRAFVDRSGERKVRVTGADARAWLHDLVTSDVASLEIGDAQRSLLLTPTGRIRADLTIAWDDAGYLLLQGSDQPDPIDALLGRYVLSSDVALKDVSDDVSVFAPAAPTALVIAERGSASEARGGLLRAGLIEAGPEAAEVWRIRRGEPLMGVDFAQDALPAEAGLEWTIDITKGCFLGQESVARVRNLGHPPTVLRHVVGPAALRPGSPVMAGGVRVGEITSAAAAADGMTVAIARVRWEASGGVWTSPDGSVLEPVEGRGN
jgi:tRNA-modifying protein YgfZ